MSCTSCGTENPPGTEFCEVCGTPTAGVKRRKTVLAAAPDPARKSRTLFDPGPARPVAAPGDVFASPPPPRAKFDPADPFASAVSTAPRPLQSPKAGATLAPPARHKTILERAPSGPAAPAAVLLVSGAKTAVLPLPLGRCHLGRDAGCDVVIEDGKVSGSHGFLYVRDDGATFIDVSSNGTIVDGEAILGESRPLSHGSVITLGAVRAVLLLIPADARVALAGPG